MSADIFNNYAVKEKQTQRGARGTLHTLAPVANIPRSDKKRGRDREREGGRGEREWGEPRATNHKKKVAQTTTLGKTPAKQLSTHARIKRLRRRAHQKEANTFHAPPTRQGPTRGKEKKREEGIHRFKREKREEDCVSDESPEAPTRTGAPTHGHEAQQCEKSIDRWA